MTKEHEHKLERMAEASRIMVAMEDEVTSLWPGTDWLDRMQTARVLFERTRLQLAQAWKRQEDRQEDRSRMARVAATLDSTDATLRKLASSIAASTVALKPTGR